MKPFPLRSVCAGLLALFLGLLPAPAAPLDQVDLTVSGGDRTVRALIEGNSLLWARRRAPQSAAVDVFADAQADYARLIAALYDAGYYSAVISIRLDGREAADIAPLDAPAEVRRADLRIDPGPRFTFSQASLAPLAPGTELPEGFASGKPASSGMIRQAAEAAIIGWRERGHAKAAIASADLTADHEAATLAALVDLEPGPKLRFGDLTISGNDRMRANRIRKIAGLTPGTPFTGSALEAAESRLLRTGIFSAVTIEEAASATPEGLLPLSLSLQETAPRRYSFGLELSSRDGVNLNGEWLHRNLWGGGERFSLGFAISNLTPSLAGTDYSARIGLERPASPFPGTTGGVFFDLESLDEPDFTQQAGSFGLNFAHVFSPELSADLGLSFAYSSGTDALGAYAHRSLSLPLGLTWDRRDQPNDATRRFLIDLEAKPFLGFGATENGLRMTFDARGYAGLGPDRRLVLAARLQGGAILGASPLGAPRDELFYSGGGGTVRGQPYQSLGITQVTPGGTLETGGTGFLAASLEARVRISPTFGAVAFVDVGTVGAPGTRGSHAGAGIGLRYQTGFGPVRVDLAVPLGGAAGGGPLVYVGLGQAF